jgi:hypothetical protein
MSKKPKSKGALKHGAYAQQVILPGEDRHDYALMLVELYEEWAPEGLTERELVDRLASLYWRRRRLHLYQQAKLQQRVDTIKANNDWIGHQKFLKALAPEFAESTSVKAVERILSRYVRYRDLIVGWVPRVASQEETKWGPAIADYLSKLKIESRLEGKDVVVRIIDILPAEMDFEWKVSDRLDEDIDRTIKRLIQVRTSKALFPRKDTRLSSKLIDVSPNNDNGSAAVFEKEQAKELPATAEKNTKPASDDNEPKPVNYNDVGLKTS